MTVIGDDVSVLPSLADESVRSGGGRTSPDGWRTLSTDGLEAPGRGEKLPGARVCGRPDDGGCPGCIVAAQYGHVTSSP